jgi:hypothetical protein
MHRRLLSLAGALMLTLAVPSAAQATPALVTPLEPCYATAGTVDEPQGEGVMVSATGFTPNASVDLTIDARQVPGGDGLQTGVFGELLPVEVPAPFIRRGTRTFTLTVAEVGNPANVLTATAKTTALGVTVRPRSAEPTSRVRFAGSGFLAPKWVYAHYLLYERNPYDVAGQRGKLMRTVRIKRPRGGCGRFAVRRPQIPLAEPRLGYWLVQFDQRRRYTRPPTTAFHQLLIRVFQRAQR